jgi:hypothetical protein
VMLEGKCSLCGLYYHGKALSTPRNRICVKCGSALDLRKDGIRIINPFAGHKAEKYVVNSDRDQWEDLSSKNLLFYLTLN